MDIFIHEPGIRLGKTGELMVLKKGNIILRQIPFYKISQIFIESNGVSLSSDLINFCSENGIVIVFLARNGDCSSYLYPLKNSNYAQLRVKQMKLSASRGSLDISRKIIIAKLKNQSYLLKYFCKYQKKIGKENIVKLLETKSGEIADIISNELRVPAVQEDAPVRKLKNQMMITEAKAAGFYWQGIKSIVPEELGFYVREQRHPGDFFNKALNYGYGILYAKLLKIAIACRLDPYIGLLHSPQRNKPVLTFDLIESFRQYVVDRPLIAAINKGTKFEKENSKLLTINNRRKIAEIILMTLNKKLKYGNTLMRFCDLIKHKVEDIANYIKGEKDKRQLKLFTMVW